jgi:hypothetical protein
MGLRTLTLEMCFKFLWFSYALTCEANSFCLFFFFFGFDYQPKARVCINANIVPHIEICVFALILSTPMILVKYTIFSMVLGRQVECLQMMGCSQLCHKYEPWYLGYQKCLPHLLYLNMPFNFETLPSPFFNLSYDN